MIVPAAEMSTLVQTTLSQYAQSFPAEQLPKTLNVMGLVVKT